MQCSASARADVCSAVTFMSDGLIKSPDQAKSPYNDNATPNNEDGKENKVFLKRFQKNRVKIIDDREGKANRKL